jgi:hypothetical protein
VDGDLSCVYDGVRDVRVHVRRVCAPTSIVTVIPTLDLSCLDRLLLLFCHGDA